MRIAGIIAEYNPFHLGHHYQLEQTRISGATHIAVVMSGSFVQRGEPAMASKWSRAQAALEQGADLVAELPAAWAVSSARRFGQAGVFLLRELGADFISFGSEAGDPVQLRQALRRMLSAEKSPEMSRFLAEGKSYPRARAEAAAALYGEEAAALLKGANNLLGLEYLRAAEELAPDMEFLTVPRIGAGHDAANPEEGFSSASALRQGIRSKGLEICRPFLPEPSFRLLETEIQQNRAPSDMGRLERVLLAQLRRLAPEDFALLPDVNEGLEHRLFRASQTARSLAEWEQTVKTKRYTLARIRRILCAALLEIPATLPQGLPEYLRILGCNQRGLEILAQAKRNPRRQIPIGTSFARLFQDQSLTARLSLQIDCRATDYWALSLPEVLPTGLDFTQPTLFLSKKHSPETSAAGKP